MTSVIDPPPAVTRPGVRTALIVAVAGSAMAGLIHGAAVGSHDDHRVLVWMFSVCAAAQLCWAAVAVMRPSRRVLAAGLLLNASALLFWAASRTVGIPFIDPLAEVEAVGAQDLGAAIFAAAVALGAGCILLRPVARVVVTPVWTGVLAAFALLAAMPALTAGDARGHDAHLETTASLGHSDGEAASAGHDDDASEGHDATDSTHDGDDGPDGHTTDSTGEDAHTGHADSTDATGDHHGTTATTGGHDHTTLTTGGNDDTTATTGGHDHTTTTTGGTVDPPTGPIISLDDPRVTPAQRAIAESLISDASTALSAYPNVAAVEAAGYVSIGDGGTDGFEHYVKWSYLTDGIELDPSRMESIVVKKNGSAPKEIVSAMYILNLGTSMANTPALAGELTSWHLHDNLCFSGTALVAIAQGGVCPPPSVLVVTPPMLHVWMIPRPCGPFAGLEETGETCATHEH